MSGSTIPPLVAAFYTLAGFRPFESAGPSPHPLRLRIEAAARAGYSGIGVDCVDLAASVAEYGHAGIKAMLADNGLDFFEVEGLGDWFAAGAAREASDVVRRNVLMAAERIGVSHVKLTGNVVGRSVPAATMRAEFARFCANAADAGTRATLEMVGISDIADLETARFVIGDTATRNGGLCADIWHFQRGGVPYSGLADMWGMVGWVELDDGRSSDYGSVISAQLDERRLPGEGDFDMAGFLAAIGNAGYAGGMGVEILSNEMRALSLDEAAQRSFAAARGQLEKHAARTSA
ncbi:MAG: sugar phosphate isomerase/epimerase [Sphingomonadales bacterium]|nr:sugar phosphate isomerase/epimerase [Sphingomonadales bacterium]